MYTTLKKVREVREVRQGGTILTESTIHCTTTAYIVHYTSQQVDEVETDGQNIDCKTMLTVFPA